MTLEQELEELAAAWRQLRDALIAALAPVMRPLVELLARIAAR